MASSREEKREKYRGDGESVEITQSDDPNRTSFQWLKREARGSTYSSYTQFADRPACSFDFGSNGYTASCNLGGELCQLTIPSEEHGVITARGADEHSLGALIASMQRYTSNAFTFGLRLVSISSTRTSKNITVKQGPVVERGAFNHRWPFHESILIDPVSNVEAGTCAQFCFIREGVLYQVMRLEQECRPEAKECLPFRFPVSSQIDLDINPPKSFTAFPGRGKVSSYQFEAKLYHYTSASGEPQFKEHFSGPTADCRFKVTINKDNCGPNPDSVIFLLAMTVCEKATSLQVNLPPLTSAEIFAWVGADPSSSWATGAMWETIFFRREHKTNWTSELSEVNLVARCLQRILHVDIVPQGPVRPHKKRPLALLSNIILGAELDWQALFPQFSWKVRFLSKAEQFLTPHRTSTLLDVDFVSDVEVAPLHSTLIRGDMERILAFVCRFLEPSEDRESPLLSAQRGNPSSHYYVMITIWYLVKNGISLPDNSVNTLAKQQSRLAKMVPDDNSHFSQDESAKTALLKWYHYSSIEKLVESGFLHPSWRAECSGADTGSRLLHDKVRRLRRAAKMTLAAAISWKRPYSPRDEIVDRLAFLESELGLEHYEAQISFLATKRIRERVFTKSINPGYLRRGQKGDTSAPWETYSLCHHSRLVLANRDRGSPDAEGACLADAEKMEVYRANLSLFLTTDASLIPCWDRKIMASGEAWLHSEPTAVLATTLLDIYLMDMEISCRKQVERDGRSEASAHTQQPALDSDWPINWQTFRPPRRYHPPEVAQSLDDTPHKYDGSMMKLIRVPNNMRTYLGQTRQTEWGEWNAQRLSKSGVADKVSLVDILAFDPKNEDATPRVLGRLSYFNDADFVEITPEVFPELVEALVFVMHQESVDCLANHLLGFSRFFCHAEEPWVARITLRSWHLDDSKPAKRGATSKPEAWANSKKEDDPIQLPEKFQKALKKLDLDKYREHMKRPKRITLSLSSMVISTNPFGDFSKTTIVSNIVSGPKLRYAGNEAQELWRMFVHQPQTARCLVFLLFLGLFAQEIEKQYIDAADHLIGNWNLDDNLLGNEIDNFEGKDSVETLNFIMWRLESLHKLQKSLDETVEAVSYAKSELFAQIYDKRTNKRSKGLESVCQEVIEVFESRLLALEAARMRIHHTVDLNRRQRDDTNSDSEIMQTSTIVEFYQNQRAFDQNMTIQKFTYITILYLPAGLMSAIFAIPNEQRVVQEGMGVGWFIFAIALLLTFNTTVAIQLPRILAFFTNPPKPIGKDCPLQVLSDSAAEEPKADSRRRARATTRLGRLVCFGQQDVESNHSEEV
ncbi:hypothetical protein B0I37DRAFT_433101 [Chaetomium sp. MPI-CAGE-AT-0009]|nr:hypothetical protein B0I37DRAFT_433101 [Chaetomium sp. MPI-CAGE-AT-0009]